MSQNTLGATAAAAGGPESEQISERNVSAEEFARLQEKERAIQQLRAEWDAEKKQSPEEIKREQEEHERRVTEYQEAQRIRIALQNAENQQREKMLKQLRRNMSITEKGRMQLRESDVIPPAQLEKIQQNIQGVLNAKKSSEAGVLGEGIPASSNERFVGQSVVGSAGQRPTSFSKAEGQFGEDRSEPTTAGISLAELSRQSTAPLNNQVEEAFERIAPSSRTPETLRSPVKPAATAEQLKRRADAIKRAAQLSAEAAALRASHPDLFKDDDKKTGAA